MPTETYVRTPAGRYTIRKDPNATLDYPFDWTAYLALISDTIVDVEWVLSAGLTLVEEDSFFTDTLAVGVVSGGVLDAVETLTCRITTAGGRIDDSTIHLRIKQK